MFQSRYFAAFVVFLQICISLALPVEVQRESLKFIVVFKKGSTKSEQEVHFGWLLQRFDAYPGYEKSITSSIDFNTWQAYGLTAPAELAEEVRGQPIVDWVQNNQQFKVSNVQNNAPPGLARTSSKVPLSGDGPYLFHSSEGASVDVYVIDTGVKEDHPQFEGRVKFGANFVLDGLTTDGNGHGTHVAGIIGSRDFGVAKKVNIIPVRVLDANGSGTTEDLLKGLSYATVSAFSASNPSVINMSLDGPPDRVVDQAVLTLINNGHAVVAAAGNAGADACGTSPGRVPDVITVAAIDPLTDQTPAFSNFGTCVTINAPGVGIVSTWIGSAGNGSIGPEFDLNTLDGTSMACPHVTGVIALMLSKNPTLKPADIAGILIQNAPTGLLSVQAGTPNNVLFNGGEAGL